jgi:hypothetical protein
LASKLWPELGRTKASWFINNLLFYYLILFSLA